jgi:deoxyribodipyrimidine photolyase
VWLRRDLRLSDNPVFGLDSSESRPAIPVFIDDDGIGAAPIATARKPGEESVRARLKKFSPSIPDEYSSERDRPHLVWGEIGVHAICTASTGRPPIRPPVPKQPTTARCCRTSRNHHTDAQDCQNIMRPHDVASCALSPCLTVV